MIAIFGDIVEREYREFVEWAFTQSDAVMLVFRRFSKEYWHRMKEVRRELAPHRLSTRDTPLEWPGTQLLGDPKKHPQLHIDMYELSPQVRSYIQTAPCLFAWQCPDFPEDICFFRNGYCWFETVTHEGFCTLTGNDREMRRSLDTIGISYECRQDGGVSFHEKY